VRGEYRRLGVERFYREQGASYRNPHEPHVARALTVAAQRFGIRPGTRVLDLCCGSGEVTRALLPLGVSDVEGADPYTAGAYRARTGKTALELGFDQIACGALLDRRYDLIVCSFALHLLTPSRLPGVVWQLARTAPRLLVLTPHKRPVLSPHWGFELVGELLERRVRVRCYHRTLVASLAAD
jgi:2-polyprenyl-3-methyl-5-hydroxy-6-metoxy-1,4-benzoquinol methylase